MEKVPTGAGIKAFVINVVGDVGLVVADEAIDRLGQRRIERRLMHQRPDIHALLLLIDHGRPDPQGTDSFGETREFFGSGTNSGYAIFHLHGAWQLSKTVELGARVNNVFDRRYETWGAVAETLFDAEGNYTGEESDAVFVAPGAPRSFFARETARRTSSTSC